MGVSKPPGKTRHFWREMKSIRKSKKQMYEFLRNRDGEAIMSGGNISVN